MYLSILVAAFIVFVLVMTMTKDVVEGWSYRKAVKKAKNIRKKAKHIGNKASKTSEKSFRRIKKKWMRSNRSFFRKIRAEKLFESIKAKLSEIEERLYKVQNFRDTKKIKYLEWLETKSIRYHEHAKYIYYEGDIDINKLKELRVKAKNLKEYAITRYNQRMSSIEGWSVNKIRRINTMSDLTKKSIIKRYIPESDVSDVESRIEDLKQGIQNIKNEIQGYLDGIIKEIKNDTQSIIDLYETAAVDATSNAADSNVAL